MDNNSEKTDEEKIKIKEAHFLLIIPMLITFICALLDCFSSAIWGEYNWNDWEGVFLKISRTIYGYFFPSVTSMIVAMIWQNIFVNPKYGIRPNKIYYTIIGLVFYGTSFVMCLMKFQLYTSIFFGVFSIVYIGYFWKVCLNPEITKPMSYSEEEEELIKTYIVKNKIKRK